jgi:hypothetical protein
MAGAEVILFYNSTIRKLLVTQPRISCSFVVSRVIIREILEGNTQFNHFLENIEGISPKFLLNVRVCQFQID